MAYSNADLISRGVGLAASGYLLTSTFSASSVVQPAIKDGSLNTLQRLTLWNEQYTVSARRWLPISFGAMLSYGFAAFNTRDSPLPLLFAAGSMAMIHLWSALVMANTSKTLKTGQKENAGAQLMVGPRAEQTRQLITKWEKLNRVRIALSAIAFALGSRDILDVLAQK